MTHIATRCEGLARVLLLCLHFIVCTSALTVEADDVVLTSGPLRFQERLVWGEGRYVYGITATDIDGDGDLDLSSAGVHSDTLLWHENDGQSNLTPHAICENEPGYLERHAFGDINGDRHLDVVIVKNKIGHLLWFENEGSPTNHKLWKRHVVTTNFMRAYDVTLLDLDQDGDLDVAGSAYLGHKFSWFENPGPGGLDQEWKQFVFDQGDVLSTRCLIPADFNRDGKIDLLATATLSNLTIWYQNTGEPGERMFRRNVVDNQTAMPTHGQPVDLDHDGDVDIVMAAGMRVATSDRESHQVAWYENVGSPGSGQQWKKHFVGELLFGFEAVTGDLDGDGDLDILASGCSGGQPNLGEVCWFENSGDPLGPWKKHPFKQYPQVVQVLAVDFDRDGRMDVAACSEAGSFYWWKNLGPSLK